VRRNSLWADSRRGRRRVKRNIEVSGEGERFGSALVFLDGDVKRSRTRTSTITIDFGDEIMTNALFFDVVLVTVKVFKFVPPIL
jgi:hypothetical protein